MSLQQIFLIVLGLVNIYMFFIRLPVYRYINDNWESERVFAYYRREDWWVLATIGFLFVQWVVTTVDVYYKFLY